MAAKKKGPGKGHGPSARPPSPAKRTTVPKAAPAPPPAAGKGPPDPRQQATPGGESTDKTQPQAGPTGPAATKGQAGKPAQPAAGSTKSAAPKGQAGKPAQPAAGSTKAAAAAPKSAAAAPKPAAGSSKAAAASPGRAVSGKAASAGKPGSAGKGSPRGGPTREERLAAAEAARRRRSLRNKGLLAAAVAVVMLVVGFVVVSDRRESEEQAAAFESSGSCDFDRRSDPDGGPGRNHVPAPTYKVDPPSGGDHTSQAAGPAVYTAADAPADGPLVHALEHGYVNLWHRPDLDEQSLTALRELAQKHGREVLMVPRASLDTPVAATAWHVRLRCRTLDIDALERFIDTFVDQAPEKGFITR